MLPRHWTCISEADRRRDPHRYISYRDAMGPDCPAMFPVMAKDLSQNDLTGMSVAEGIQKLQLRHVHWDAPLDGDGPNSRRYAY